MFTRISLYRFLTPVLLFAFLTFPATAQQRPRLNFSMFSMHRFSSRRIGVPWKVERDGYGWLLMRTNQDPQRERITLKVTAPEALEFELYLDEGTGKCTYRDKQVIPAKGVNTTVFPSIRARWTTWGNVLLFKADEATPETFKINLAFYDAAGEKLFSHDVDMESIAHRKPKPVSQEFSNRLFYAYPLRRIDFSDPRAAMARETLAYARGFGLDTVGHLEYPAEGSPAGNPGVPGEIFTQIRLLPYNSQTSLMRELMEKYQIPHAMNVAGAADPNEIEPQVFLEKAAAMYKELLARNKNEAYRDQKFAWISDYEPYAYEGPVTKYSFAPESIAAFRQYLKLPETAPLTPREILEKYKSQWIRFRCSQRAELVKLQADAVREYASKGIYALCSASLPEFGVDEECYFEEFGIDLRQVDSYVDLHMPMIYERDALFYRRTHATVAQLQKPVFVTVNCGYDLGVYRPYRLFRLMIGSAFLGARGVYHWPGLDGMDVEFLQNINRAMVVINRIIPFVDASQPPSTDSLVTCPNTKPQDFFFAERRKDNNYMVLLVNESKQETLYPIIAIPNEAGISNIFELVEQHRITTKNNLLTVELPPDSIRIIHFGPDAGLDVTPTTTVDAEATAAKAQQQQARYEAARKGAAAHGMSYRTVSEVLELKTPAQELKLDMTDCALGEWLLPDGTRLLKQLGIIYFDHPAALKIADCAAQIDDIRITPQAVELTCSFTIAKAPYDGLVVCKTFTVLRDAAKVNLAVRIIPAGGYRQFALRLNHCIDREASFLLHDQPASGVERYGNVFWRNGFNGEALFDNKQTCRRGTFTENDCSLVLSPPQARVDCSFGNDVKGLMTWQRPKIATMELIYGKAYSDNDPHKVQEWEYRCVLTAKKLHR